VQQERVLLYRFLENARPGPVTCCTLSSSSQLCLNTNDPHSFDCGGMEWNKKGREIKQNK